MSFYNRKREGKISELKEQNGSSSNFFKKMTEIEDLFPGEVISRDMYNA